MNDQIAKVAGFHQLSEDIEPRSLESWRELAAPWKARMGLMVTVGELRALLDEVERLRVVAREVVVCSAIRLPDGRIIRGHRHGDCIRTAHELVEHQHGYCEGPPWHSSMASDQGFVTSTNRYVDREEGMRLQLAAGIESACRSGYRDRELFSEDLY